MALNKDPKLIDVDPDVIFCLDLNLRLTSCNSAWDHFAVTNGAPELCRPALIGHSLLDHIAEPDRAYYKKVFEDLSAHSRPWGRLYECSSPSHYRQFQMRVLPLMEQGGLMVINSIQIERPHDGISCAAIEERFRNPNGMIVMCPGCRRTRRAFSDQPAWDWVPGFLERVPRDVSHWFCPLCSKQYYP